MKPWYSLPLIGVVVGAILGFIFSFVPALVQRRRHEKALLCILKAEMNEMLDYRRTKLHELNECINTELSREKQFSFRFAQETDADISFLKNAHSYSFLGESDLKDLTRIFHRMGAINAILNQHTSGITLLSPDEYPIFISSLKNIRDDMQELVDWIESLTERL